MFNASIVNVYVVFLWSFVYPDDTINLLRWQTSRRVLWQTVKTQMRMPHYVPFYEGVHCLLGQKTISKKEILDFLEIIICDP